MSYFWHLKLDGCSKFQQMNSEHGLCVLETQSEDKIGQLRLKNLIYILLPLNKRFHKTILQHIGKRHTTNVQFFGYVSVEAPVITEDESECCSTI